MAFSRGSVEVIRESVKVNRESGEVSRESVEVSGESVSVRVVKPVGTKSQDFCYRLP